MIDAGGGAVSEAYEQLRRHVVAALPGSGRFGLAVLLREGVAAWIERGAANVPFNSVRRPGEEPPLLLASPSVLTPPLHAGLVQILASIALSRTQEIRS